MSDHLGYDDTVQAATGIMIRFGGSRQTPEEHAHFGTIDVLGGFCAAMGAAAALLRREKTGLPGRARSSLMAAGQLIQLPFMYDHPGRGPFDEPGGRHVLGNSPHYRFYKASDGWFFLACANEAELDGLATLAGFENIGSATDMESFLADRFSELSVKACLEVLSQLDIGATRPSSLADLRDRYVKAGEVPINKKGGTYQFVCHDIKQAGRGVELFAPCAIRPAVGEIKAFPPAEKYGASTKNILKSLGYDNQSIKGMLSAGVVSLAWCDEYLPE